MEVSKYLHALLIEKTYTFLIRSIFPYEIGKYCCKGENYVTPTGLSDRNSNLKQAQKHIESVGLYLPVPLSFSLCQ
jgi:hypothetical protein